MHAVCSAHFRYREESLQAKDTVSLFLQSPERSFLKLVLFWNNSFFLMRSYYLPFIGGLLCLRLWAVATTPEARDALDRINSLKGGILVKDGKRTSCELGVVDSRSAVVSPICMGYTTTNRTQPGVKFEVYLDAGIDGKTAKYTVENITIHPGLNSSGLNNDIAVIKYNSAGPNEWQNPVYPDYLFTPDSAFFVRHSLLDMDKMQWDTPQYAVDTITLVGSDACKNASALFQYNSDVLTCGNQTMATPLTDLTPCRVPYGVVYGLRYNRTYLMGTLNHASVWDVDNLCGDNTVYSYFIKYARYTLYIESVLGYSVRTDSDLFTDASLANDPNFTVRYPFSPDDPRLTIFDGDFYKDQKEQIVFPITELSAETSLGSAANNISSGGLSRGAKIAIGVCVSIGGLLIISAVATYMFLRRKRQKARVVDTLRQQEIHDALVPDLGAAILPASIITGSERDLLQTAEYDPPPVYMQTVNEEREQVESKPSDNK